MNPSKSNSAARAMDQAQILGLTTAERMALALRIGITANAFKAIFETRGKVRQGPVR